MSTHVRLIVANGKSHRQGVMIFGRRIVEEMMVSLLRSPTSYEVFPAAVRTQARGARKIFLFVSEEARFLRIPLVDSEVYSVLPALCTFSAFLFSRSADLSRPRNEPSASRTTCYTPQLPPKGRMTHYQSKEEECQSGKGDDVEGKGGTGRSD
ncbi:hypothetical protein BDV96DRAFT_607367 [Lophiotrema nucula]|uniref:Uncharacterized protein n=1 Tax=Lophiotrema nucula TaxID=690887 RepID=A0A6A5YJV4_9PLEO|nr:hypothetical protein BDV96DRAFT_607367 [Lophiotrema nucula]